MRSCSFLQGFIAGQQLRRYLSFSSMSGRKPVASVLSGFRRNDGFQTFDESINLELVTYSSTPA